MKAVQVFEGDGVDRTTSGWWVKDTQAVLYIWCGLDARDDAMWAMTQNTLKPFPTQEQAQAAADDEALNRDHPRRYILVEVYE